MRVLALACLVAVAAAMPQRVQRQKVHPERQQMIDEINSRTDVLWKATAHARFAADAPGAAKVLCGVKDTNSETTARMVKEGSIHMAPKISAKRALELPESFDSATNWPQCAKTIGDIRDQSACGCCWAFGAAEATSDRMCVATNGTLLLPLSAQEMCFCAHFAGNGCMGGELAPAWMYVKNSGLVTGSQNKGLGPFGSGYCSQFSLPHCHHHGPQGSDPYPDEGTPGCPTVSQNPQCPHSCDSDAKAPHNDFKNDRYTFSGQIETYPSDADTIAAAIMEGGPAEVAFTVYSDFENYQSGVYHHVSGQMLGGHAVKLVGWGVDNGTKYWKVANSWNPYWGEHGYFRIVRGTNECGIEDDVVATKGVAQWHKM